LRAGFGEMGLWPVVAHRLADFEFRQFAYHIGPDQKRNQQRRHHGQHRAQRNVVEYIECADVFRQPLE
jgi:hypothetical protein